ncbi:MAG: sortase [Candidatus Pacebacteria bacterium]|jgi:LPXTG-site transpeptidase (sortase) family protein|nr:sortase [Candidatus Paceibacterota bacterium]
MPQKIRRKKIYRPGMLEKVVLPAMLLVFFGLIALFWENISWVVNGDVWRQLAQDAFPQYFPRPYVVIIKPKVPVVAGNATSTEASATSTAPATTTPDTISKPRRDMITIPKMGVTAPIITSQTADNDVIHSLLDSGVVLYPGSAPFGTEGGQTVLLGHSAPTGWPKIKYDWVFSKLNLLEEGDMVVITYDNQTRYYKVVKTRVVTPQAGVPEPTVKGNSLMLVTCWPPGKDLKRMAVEATIYKESQ